MIEAIQIGATIELSLQEERRVHLYEIQYQSLAHFKILLLQVDKEPRMFGEALAGLALWLGLLITLIAGAVGGVVYELLILQGNIELPHKLTSAEAVDNPHAVAQFMYDLGIWARIIIGASAALAALLVIDPETIYKLIASALIAGSAGTSIFRSLQDRLLAALAQKDVAELRAVNQELGTVVEETRDAFGELKSAIRATPPPPSARAMSPASASVIDLTLVDKVEQLLNEAKGISQRAQLK